MYKIIKFKNLRRHWGWQQKYVRKQRAPNINPTRVDPYNNTGQAKVGIKSCGRIYIQIGALFPTLHD